MNMSDFDHLGYTELFLIIGACLMLIAELYGAKMILFLILYVLGSCALVYIYIKFIEGK